MYSIQHIWTQQDMRNNTHMHFRNLHGLFGDTLGWLLNRRKIWRKTWFLQSFPMFLWPNLGEATIYWIVACTTTSWEVVLWAHHVPWNLATQWSWTGQVGQKRGSCHVSMLEGAWWKHHETHETFMMVHQFTRDIRHTRDIAWIGYETCEVSCAFFGEDPWR